MGDWLSNGLCNRKRSQENSQIDLFQTYNGQAEEMYIVVTCFT